MADTARTGDHASPAGAHEVGRIAGIQRISFAFFFEDQQVLFARNSRVIESRGEMTGRRTEITVAGWLQGWETPPRRCPWLVKTAKVGVSGELGDRWSEGVPGRASGGKHLDGRTIRRECETWEILGVTD